METRTVELNSLKAEIVSRTLAKELREGNLNQPEEAAVRELRKDIATAKGFQKIG